MPQQAWLSSVTDSNHGTVDFVAKSWQHMFTCSACKEEKNRQIPPNKSRFQVRRQKS